jgi:hypothetical protein
MIKLKPYESEVFTFYTGYVGNAKKTNISLKFGTVLIEDCIFDKKYTAENINSMLHWLTPAVKNKASRLIFKVYYLLSHKPFF